MPIWFAIRAIALYQCSNLDIKAPDAIHVFYELATSGNSEMDPLIRRETFESLTELRFHIAFIHKRGDIHDLLAAQMYQAADRAGTYGTMFRSMLVDE